jgi:hypothetical protein
MKCRSLLCLLAGLALLLPVAAVAKDKDQGKVQLANPVHIGTTQLKPGTYKVEWSGNGPVVNINFVRNDKTVATTSGRVVHLKKASPYNAVVVNTKAKTLDEIDFSNRTEALRIAPNTGRSKTS